jgi:NAD(P)-dependent dehydrogenase (short-subunit alcohol dehydrogenase family)
VRDDVVIERPLLLWVQGSQPLPGAGCGDQPLGRLVTADEIAFAVANLASPRAVLVSTGTILTIDGGLIRLPV